MNSKEFISLQFSPTSNLAIIPPPLPKHKYLGSLLGCGCLPWLTLSLLTRPWSLWLRPCSAASAQHLAQLGLILVVQSSCSHSCDQGAVARALVSLPLTVQARGQRGLPVGQLQEPWLLHLPPQMAWHTATSRCQAPHAVYAYSSGSLLITDTLFHLVIRRWPP